MPITDIKWLPEQFVNRLAAGNCAIPKNIIWSGGVEIPATSILVGQFARLGQYDIAVICHTEKMDNIYTHWGGPTKCAEEVSSWGESIEIVDEQYIVRHFEAYGGNKPIKIIHDALNDVIVGKGSIVRYCRSGEWLEFTGAD